MGSRVQQALRALCFDTQWKYAVFWKLQHRTRMMLTWEDACYCNINHPEKNGFSPTMGDFQDGHCSTDPLGLAVAKMSYNVYSLGEGIVGQVAVTGTHMWISADNFAEDPGSLFECGDGLQTQFSAGIKTIAVVAVVPHGVLQLGSVDRIAEDMRIVNHVRNIFFCMQDSIPGPISIAKGNGSGRSCLLNMPPRTPGKGIDESTCNLDTTIQEDAKIYMSPAHLSHADPVNTSYIYSLPGGPSDVKMEMINSNQRPKNLMIASDKCGRLQPVLEHDQQKQKLGSVFDTKCEGESGGCRQFAGVLDSNAGPCIENSVDKSSSLMAPPWMDVTYFPPEISNYGHFIDQKRALPDPEVSVIQLPKDVTSDHMDALHMPTRFSAGYELYEALGPAFQKQSIHHDWGSELTGTDADMSEGMVNSSTEHLLEAVVANINQNGNDTNCETSCHKSVKSLLAMEKMAEPCLSDVGTISSAGYSFDHDTLNSLNSSDAYSMRSSKGISSTSSSKGSGLLERPQEPMKTHRKRARPGESCRPRPRDRQLIQDRIKELRELVPNGSKCSIDSLLERTIKHMLFMQSITKHADKLKNCTASKLLDKEAGIRRSSCDEQGSSWAVEVGSNLKVCPIIVENINMNGQMLVEMLCEDGSHFLEVAEAIRSLGLTILKGVTEAYGEKTWMHLVVEGTNNRSVHRMELLWCLMNLLQPKLSN